MFENSLAERLRGARHLLIIGVGNELGCDDAAGIELSRRVKREFTRSRRVSVIEAGPSPENFTSVVRKLNPSHILVVDAAQMGLTPGSLRIIDKNEIKGFSFSTHYLPLSFLISYLEKGSRAAIIVVGIEPLNVGFGKKLSEPVMNCISKLIEMLRRIVTLTD